MRRMDGYGMAPLEGGFSGETFLAEAAGERTVVRLYVGRGAARGPAAVEIDAAVLRLVRGLVPVPEVLEVRRADEAAGIPSLLVTSFVPGERLDLLLPRLGATARTALGERLGRMLGRLAQVPMLRAGELADGELRVRPWPFEADLPGWVARHREALVSWTPEEYDALLAVAERAQQVLDRVERVCLVHSDMNPKNLLVDTASLQVTAVLDWEFAHAGLPVTDLGNLLRFDRDPAFADAVLAGYLASTGGLDGLTDPGLLLDAARAADLYALVDLAARRGGNPVADRADALLRVIAASGSLHSE